MLGVVAVPGGAGGFLLGSYLIKRLSLTTGQQLRAMFFLSVVCLGTMLMFAVQCDTAPLADVWLHQTQQNVDRLADTSLGPDYGWRSA